MLDLDKKKPVQTSASDDYAPVCVSASEQASERERERDGEQCNRIRKMRYRSVRWPGAIFIHSHQLGSSLWDYLFWPAGDGCRIFLASLACLTRKLYYLNDDGRANSNSFIQDVFRADIPAPR